MPDLNELLKWSIANSTPKEAPDQANGTDEPLSLRFNPPSDTPSTGSSALHPSDPLYGNASSALTAAPHHGQTTPTPSQSALNSEILETIMGKPDSTVMKEKMDFAMDESRPVDERVEALDDFEMLIEHLDNANNMAVLKLWEPLLSLLSSPHETIVAHACWIMGTAVQNNLKAQAALYAYNALPPILNVISPSSSHTSATRSRATYALSSALKHWPLASSALSANSSRGYLTLKSGVADTEPTVKRKMAFLVGTLVMQSGEVYHGEISKDVAELIQQRTQSTEAKATLIEGLKREGVFEALLSALKSGKGEDVEFEENAVRALVNALDKGGIDEVQRRDLKSLWDGWGAEEREARGLGGEEGKEIEQKLH